MIAEHGAEKVTMDGLAERAGLGKGTVFRRFGNRAGIFRALIEDSEHRFQERVLCGPPPLGPGAGPRERLVAYGRARVPFILEHHALARSAMDPGQTGEVGAVGMTRAHFRMLLGRTDLPPSQLDGLSIQLTSALEGPMLLYLSVEDLPEPAEPAADHLLVDSWQVLVERLLPD